MARDALRGEHEEAQTDGELARLRAELDALRAAAQKVVRLSVSSPPGELQTAMNYLDLALRPEAKP